MRRPWHTNTVSSLLTKYNAMTLEYHQQKDADGKTASDLAKAAGHGAIVRQLGIAIAPRAAQEGDLAAVKQALADYPDEVRPSDLMFRACSGGSLSVVNHLMDLTKDRSPEEKLRLMNALPTSTYGVSSCLHSAVVAGNSALIKALLRRDWWPDKETLRSFIHFESPGVKSLLVEPSYRANKPEPMKLVDEALAALEKE